MFSDAILWKQSNWTSAQVIVSCLVLEREGRKRQVFIRNSRLWIQHPAWHTHPCWVFFSIQFLQFLLHTENLDRTHVVTDKIQILFIGEAVALFRKWKYKVGCSDTFDIWKSSLRRKFRFSRGEEATALAGNNFIPDPPGDSKGLYGLKIWLCGNTFFDLKEITFIYYFGI